MNGNGKLMAREWLPRGARIDVSWNVLVLCSAGEVAGQVVNVSARGFRVRTTSALEPGWKVALRFAKDSPVSGVIRWVAGNDAGGMFDEPVPLKPVS